jgi:signal transduction histidine kinase
MNPETIKVLVADDEPTIRELMSLVLERDGHAVATANDGVRALEMLQAERFDVLLSDIQMPHMNGLELLKRAKEIQPDLIVVVMTGFGTIETAVDAIKGGAADFITKPIRDLDQIPIIFKKAKQFQNLQNEVKALRELNRLQDEFLALLSHELRTPLTNLQGGLEAMRDIFQSELSADARELLGTSIEGVTGLANIVESLLMMADLQNNRIMLNKQRIDLNHLLSELFETASKTGQGCAEMALELEKEAVFADVDVKLLAHALNNIISNAVKFNKDKKDLRVTGSVTRRNGMSCLSISNNGQPIPEEEKERIFRRFKQAEHYMTRKYQGIGLGLSITKTIVEKHGGTIGVSSSQPQGVTFQIELPPAQ